MTAHDDMMRTINQVLKWSLQRGLKSETLKLAVLLYILEDLSEEERAAFNATASPDQVAEMDQLLAQVRDHLRAC